MHVTLRIRKSLLLALKVGVGSALAIFAAHCFQLVNPTAAGTVTLLTLVTSKKETVRLFFSRILTFFVTVGLCLIIYPVFSSDFLAFGLVTFFLVLITCFTHTENTLSVCALINMHFFASSVHSFSFILNEFWLILIGICIAFAFNLIQDYKSMEDDLEWQIRTADDTMAEILSGISVYILHPEQPGRIWEDCRALEGRLEEGTKAAMEYQNSLLSGYGSYFRRYFEMRTRQLHTLRALHPHLKTIRSVPEQARMISGFIEVMVPRIYRHEIPEYQLAQLRQIREEMENSPLPSTRQEFESRAILFHILLDLEQFLLEKKKFIESLSRKEEILYVHEERKRP